MIQLVEIGYQIAHAPGAVLDYGFDWSAWLSTGETITGSTWAVDSGLTQSQSAWSPTVSIVFLAGGVSGTTYTATNTIMTSAGRTDSRTYLLICHTRGV